MVTTINIKGTDYKLKQTVRAIFLWEQIAGRNFEIKNTMDNYLYFYCILLANNPEFMGWDEFIDYLDENPTVLFELSKKLTESQEIEKILYPDSEGNADNKKKD